VSGLEPIADILPRVIDRLERMRHGLRAAAHGAGRLVFVPRAVLAEYAQTADLAARELRGADGLVPARSPIRPAVRQAVLDDAYDLARDGYVCARCGRVELDRGAVHLDHIVPVARGGSNAPANLQVLCAGCNLRKGAAA
jgi:hypothetical protein